nr:hypothetical protein [Tanacetum cinerariifolium]
MLHLLRVEMVINSPRIMPILGTKELASPEQMALGKDISNPFMAVMIYQKSLGYSNSSLIHVLRVGLVINSPGYVVPTGRVIVPTGRVIVATIEAVTTAKLVYEVTTSSEIVTAASAIIPTVEPQVPAATITVAYSRRRKGVVIKDPESESATSSIISAKTKSKDKGKGIMVEESKPLKKKQQIELDEEHARKLHEELNKDIDWDETIDHVKLKAKEDPSVKRYQAMKRKPQTEVQARKNMMMYLKNVAGFRLDYFKGMSYDDIHPIFEAKFNLNVDFLLKNKEQMEEEESRAL